MTWWPFLSHTQQIGPIIINDQAAEEAFTFYDHPKVLIFKKNAEYNAETVASILGAVDLSNVVHLVPREAASYNNLMLPDDRLAGQRAGGTWSDLFDYDWLQNKYPILGLVIWYLFVFLLGVLTYPIIRLVLPGLGDKGYPLARTLGLVILAYVPWLLGSLGVEYSRVTIGLVFACHSGGRHWPGMDAQGRTARRVEVQTKILPDGRGAVPVLLRLRFTHPLGQSRSVAPGQGRRAADGLFVFQRGAEEHQFPAV